MIQSIDLLNLFYKNGLAVVNDKIIIYFRRRVICNVRPFISNNMNSDSERLVNLLGAFSVAVNDQTLEDHERIVNIGGEAPAAIVQIGTIKNLTVSNLGRILDLSQSAATRVVDKLIVKGYVVKSKGRNARERNLKLTLSGETVMGDLLDARNKAISSLLTSFSEKERAIFEVYIEKLLKKVALSEDKAFHICRLCNEEVCPQETCPITTSSRKDFRNIHGQRNLT